MAFMRPSVRSRPAPPEKTKGLPKRRALFCLLASILARHHPQLLLGLLPVFLDDVFYRFEIEVLQGLIVLHSDELELFENLGTQPEGCLLLFHCLKGYPKTL
jgi:hypothetical protein